MICIILYVLYYLYSVVYTLYTLYYIHTCYSKVYILAYNTLENITQAIPYHMLLIAVPLIKINTIREIKL